MIIILFQVFGNLLAFEAICIQCSTSAINSFRFKREIKENNERLINMVELLNGSFESFPDDMTNCRTLFVTLNPELRTSSQYLENIKCEDTYSALNRFCIISNYKNKYSSAHHTTNKIKKRIKVLDNPPKLDLVRKKRKFASRPKVDILDMMYDKKDASNIQCKECLSAFHSFTLLRSHYTRMHAPKTFKCDECPRSFGSGGLLSSHKMECHSVGLICAECGKIFNHRHTLKMHEKSHYIKLMCQKCGRVYKNHNTYKKHIDNQVCEAPTRRSQADAKFECDYCHKKYSQKMTLRVHIQYEHGNYKYLECKWCNKKFWCKSRLNAHIVKHTKERNFACTTCNGKFVTKESLLYHTRIHTGERPYKCPHCECRFLNSSRRAAHVRSQHMDATMQCDICLAKFKSYNFLHKHKKLHTVLEDEKQSDSLEEDQNRTSEKKGHVDQLKIGESHRDVIFITDQLGSGNIKLDLDDDDNVDRTSYVYQYEMEDSQDLDQGQQIYLEVADDDGDDR